MLKSDLKQKPKIDLANFHFKKAFGLISTKIKHKVDIIARSERDKYDENTKVIEEEFNEFMDEREIKSQGGPGNIDEFLKYEKKKMMLGSSTSEFDEISGVKQKKERA